MEDEIVRKDIRRLLKTFGVKADEAIIGHFAQNVGVPELILRITLEDMTDYGAAKPESPLSLTIEDAVRR